MGKSRLHLGPDTHPSEGFPLVMRDLGSVSGDGRTTWIGYLIHRDYESGHPQPWEVGRYGGSTWGFYEDEASALAGAEEYAAAFREAHRKAPDGVVMLGSIPSPDAPAGDVEHPGLNQREIGLLDSERYCAADNVRRILDRAKTEGELRSQLERYCDRLAKGPRQ